MTYDEAIEWIKGKRSMTNIIPNSAEDGNGTWLVQAAQADAAMTEQAYWVLRAYNECFISDREVVSDQKYLEPKIGSKNILPSFKDFLQTDCPSCTGKDAEITRLNAQINHIAAKLGKEHEEHVKDLIEKDKVIRAMASDKATKWKCLKWINRYCDMKVSFSKSTCSDCIINHFTKQAEAKDVR